jgi:CRP/FNR family transcriptional regulator
MTYTRGWPMKRPPPSVRTAATASARLSLARRQELLSGLALFAELKNRELRSLARIADTARFPADHEIVVEGAPGDFCFLLVEGSAEVVKGGNAVISLGPGEIFGELAMLDPGPRSATVRTISEVLALRVQRDPFIHVVGEDPRIGLRLLAVMARRLRATTEQLD